MTAAIAERTAVVQRRHAQPFPVREETLRLQDIQLQSGETLDEVEVLYRLEGTVAERRDNVVLVVHALTGDANASTWWSGVVGAGAAIDPSRHAVLCANLPGSCYGTRLGGALAAQVRLTTRDQAFVLGRLLDALDIDKPILVCGGSLGGMVTLEFAATFPHRTQRAVVFAAPAAQTAQGIAWNTLMRRAIDTGGSRDGFALARMIGMVSYRTPDGLERRFGRSRSSTSAYAVEEWLAVHGERIVERFEASSYRQLLDVMDTHDVGRGRGGIAHALAPVRDRIVAVGIQGDLLYPAECVREWAHLARCSYEQITSAHGHDAFLLEKSRVSAIISRAISGNTARASVVPRESCTDIAVAGCGVVGGAFLELLSNAGLQHLRVSGVLVRDPVRQRNGITLAREAGLCDAGVCTANASELLSATTSTLVEAIGGTGVAFELVRSALARGIRVITANKSLIALYGPELVSLADRCGTSIDFEAAVAGAVPVVRSIRSGAAGVGITRISGILNGTCNYVLDKVAAGATFADALHDAQAAGYAEAEPSRDLSGEDSEDKLRILAWLAFGVHPQSVVVHRQPLSDAALSSTSGVTRQLAECRRVGSTIVGTVRIVQVDANSSWAQVKGAANRIEVESESAGTIVFEGAGAGGRATAGAMLGELLQDVARISHSRLATSAGSAFTSKAAVSTDPPRRT